MKLILSFLLSSITVSIFAQVKLQTGTAEFNIPLYNYADPNNRIGTEISLGYTAGNGLKVNEISTSTGTGWALNAGGYIQRIQYGEPDDQKNYDSYAYPFLPNSDPQSAFWVWAKNYYPNGFLHSEFSSTDQITNRGAYTPMYPPPYYYYKPPQIFSADREQDVFKFSFNERVGYFLISRKNSSGISEIKTIYDSKLKIEKVEGDLNNTQNIRTTISKFKITDQSGIVYIFDEADIDQVCDYDRGSEYNSSNGFFQYDVSNVNSPTYSNNFRVIKGTPRNSYVKNKWNLTEIVNPLTQGKITFQYERYNIDIKTQTLIQRSISGNNDRISITQQRTLSEVNRLKKIILSSNESVDLEYSSTNRIDVPTDKSLSRVSIKYNNKTQLIWDFSYGYFVKNDIRLPDFNFSTEDKVWSRLCLLSLKKSSASGQIQLPYSFDYYRGNEDNLNSAVPPMFSSQQNLGGYYSTAIFGFYNPSTNSTSTTNPAYEPYGNIFLPKSVYQNILTGLNYNPSLGYGTGSSTLKPTIEARNGIIKTIKNPFGGELKYEFEMNSVGTVPFKPFYGVRVSRIIEYDGINHTNDKIKEYKYINDINVSNSSSAWGYENFENKELATIRLRQDCSSGIYPVLNMLSIAKSFGNYLLGQTGSLPTSGSVINIGGTQIPAFAVVYFAYIAYSILDGFFGSNNPQYTITNMDVYTNKLINNNLLPFQYSRVEIINKLGNGDIGKAIYEFTSPSSSTSFQIDFPAVSKPYSSKQRYAYWVYGLLEKLTIKDNNNLIIKQVLNIYNPLKSALYLSSYESKKWIPLQYEYSCGFNPPAEDQNAYNKISSEIYYPICGRIELTNTKEYTYSNNGQSILNETFYEYSSTNYLINKIKTFNSRGELIVKNTYYPEDYSSTGFFANLINNNIINIPISSETWITKNGGQQQLINASATEFAIIGNGDIKPSKIYGLESAAPVLQNMLQPFNPNSAVRDPNYIKEQQQYVYDNSGNLIQTISKAKTVSVLYDYIGTRASMKITNASPGEFAYTSFEADNKGGWNYNTANIQQQIVPTGKMGYQLSGGSISTNVVISKPSILSFWSTNNNIQVNGSFSPTKTVSGIQGWTYYEFELPTNSSSPVITGNALIDELRLYPKDSRMITTTYDEVGNISSECDANNHIVYYEYDGLGRILLVRDQNKNVLKKYCYNYAGQQENCNILYRNIEKSGTFTRNNCDANHTGGQKTYVVAAGTYTSGINIDDANQQAQNDVNTNGQNYANTYAACIPNIIYAKLTVENQMGNQADVVVRFYEDQAATIPYSVSNLDISISEENYNDIYGTSTYNNYTINCNGTQVVALPSVMLIEQQNDQYHSNIYRYYGLNPGTGYTVVY